jgi:hypothetical protein
MLIFLLIANGALYGQHKVDRLGKTMQILKAEIEFASLAGTSGVKVAFDKNLDSSGVIAVGNNIVNGLRAYAKAVADTSELLTWQPLYAAVNKGNSFGFTTGPFLYYAKKGEKPTGSGYYFSIWEKDSSGQFKLRFDGGVVHTRRKPKSFLMKLPNTQARVLESRLGSITASSESVEQLEAGLQDHGNKFYQNYLSADCIILRPEMPVFWSAKQYLMVASKQAEIRFVAVQKRMVYDDTKSFFYEYGNLAKSQKDNVKGTFCGYYVRVWQCQKSGWKIVADVKQFS